MKRRRFLTSLGLIAALPGLISTQAFAQADKYPSSLLYSQPVKVAEGVYAAIGATQGPSYENAGHNNNMVFVIGEHGVLVFNAGASYLVAKALHDEIKKHTNKPILYMVAENGDLHATTGNHYWKQQGAELIAHQDAVRVFETNKHAYLESTTRVTREKADGTKMVSFDRTFDSSLDLDLGGITAQVRWLGSAHVPGDISIILAERNVVLAGDIAFHERLLNVLPETDTLGWVQTWQEFAKLARDKIIVPGHGSVTRFEQVNRYTHDYLVYMHQQVRELIEQGGGLADASKIDQTQFSHLNTFEELAAINASRIFAALEFE